MREQQDIVVIWRQSGPARDESGAAATIVWATGYGYDYGWARIPVFDARGRPAQQRGVTTVPGLYFLGLHWMHTFKACSQVWATTPNSWPIGCLGAPSLQVVSGPFAGDFQQRGMESDL
jgi:hypothetical protein